MKELLQLQKEGKLPTDELTTVEKQLIQTAILQEQNKARWAAILQEQGISKTAPSTMQHNATIIAMKPTWWSSVKVLSMAASLLFALIGGWWIFANSNNNLQNDVTAFVASESFSPDGSVTRGGGGNATTTSERYSNAYEMYGKQQFQSVIQALEGFDNLETNEYMLLGYAYAKNQKPDFQKAITCFEKVQEEKYRENQVMMLAFCHIQLEHFGVAKKLLTEIIQNPNASNKHIQNAKALESQINVK
jgi:tetratricopeptide (TPR) repeat protein